MRADEEARRAVACPLCKAAAGQPCINTSTRHPFIGFTHLERRKAAKETING